jgi:predicted flavoprotein YhiN
MSFNQVIVVGGGLAGCSAANTVLERGGRVLLLDKVHTNCVMFKFLDSTSKLVFFFLRYSS